MANELQALIFDVDGTLADTERDGHRVAAAFAEVELDWQWSEALYGELLSVRGGKERIRFYLEKFNAAFKNACASSMNLSRACMPIRHGILSKRKLMGAS